MLNEKNFADALEVMNFTRRGTRYEKIFAEGVTMSADLKANKLFYPAQVKGRDRNTACDKSHRENLVVFECVCRLLDKGYKPADIELERAWQLGHSSKGGRADICVSSGGKVLFIIECKTAGNEFNHERDNMLADGGQLFSYWQQENSCQWLVLYASDFVDGKLKFSAASVPCSKELYRDADTVPERFKVWRERYDKKFFGDVIFHDETTAYQIGVPPLRKRDLIDFSKIDKPVNQFEEILRHNVVSNKANAFDVLIALFICKLVDEKLTDDKDEVSFQFRDGADTYETFQDRLQKLYADGMEQFMKEPITYVPLKRVDELLGQIGKIRRNALSDAFKAEFRKLKFFNNNAFAFIDVHNEKLFYRNGKVLVEVVRMLQNYFIIGSEDLQTLGNLFEQLLNKGFKQDEGQFFTPTPITRFIWDSLPLDEIIADESPKIIDYACGAGHFLTEGFQAVNACYDRKNLPPPALWERDKLFGVEKDDRLARVSKISLFMHGANEGKIKFGDGLEDYPDEGISPETFDILVANPPYSVKGFKNFIKLANDKLTVLDKISNDGSEIETLFAERISQLVKPKGVAAVILPSSILNKDGKSFVAARESLLKNFYLRAVVQLGSKTFGATGTNTVILFMQKIFDPPERSSLVKDSAEIILNDAIQLGDEEEDIFAAYTKKIGVKPDDYRKSLDNADEKFRKLEREKIIYFALTYRQQTLIISAPDDYAEQEKFLGYAWSNAKGREGLVDKKRGGLLFDNDNRTANDTLAAVIRAAYDGQRLNLPALDKYFHYAKLADLLDFDAADFSKKITLGSSDYAPAEYSGNFPLVKLEDVAPFVTERTTLDEIQIADFITTDNMLKDKRGVKPYEGVPQVSGLVKFSAGDVLVSNIRPYLKKIWLADRAGGCSPDVLVFRVRDENILRPEYLFEVLREDDFFAFAMATAGGMKMPRGNKDKIKSYKFPLPPLDVQKQIVDEFNAIDAKLAAQDDTIRSLDADIKTKFAALFDNENNFSRLDNVADEIIQGTSPKSKFYNDGGKGIPFYQGKKDFGEQFLNPPTMWTSEAIKTSIKGDILMSVRAPVGDVNLNPFDEICIGRGLAAIRLNETAMRNYVFYWLYFHNDEISGHKGSTFDSISGSELRAIKLPLPPLALQEEFASYVKNCEALKSAAQARRAELIAVRSELVTKYFR